MKTSIKTIILAAASIFSAMSCQKEAAVPGTQDQIKTGETIQVNINACLGDLVSADGTKATAESVIRLKWNGTESHPEYVKAYCGTNLISTEDGLKAIASENGLFAKLTGEITTTDLTSGTSVITFIYSNGCTVSDDGLTFDFTNQTKTGGIPFVAYATLVYDGTATLTGKMVEFKFATSVMKIAATDLGGGKITGVAISGINTKVTLDPSTNKESPKPAITGGPDSPAKDITTDNFSSSPDSARAIVTVGLVPDESTERKISFTKGSVTKTLAITSEKIGESTSYYTPCAFEGADIDFVIIGGRKWATMNLGAETVNDYGRLYSWGNLTGQSGDDGYSPFFTEDNYNGTTGVEPTEGSKINDTDHIWTKTKHDAAYNELGGSWRMPTKDDFINLDIACGGTGENEQTFTGDIASAVNDNKVKRGKYWLAEGQTYFRGIDKLKDITAAGLLYSDGENYLFFPAAGGSASGSRDRDGFHGFYWSGIWSISYAAYSMDFDSDYVFPQYSIFRYLGGSVRPVSD